MDNNSNIGTEAAQILSSHDTRRNILVWIAPGCPDLNRLKQSEMIRVVDSSNAGPLLSTATNLVQPKATDKLVIPGVEVVVPPTSNNHQNDNDDGPATAETTTPESSTSDVNSSDPAHLFLENAMNKFWENVSTTSATQDDVLRQVFCVVTDNAASIEHFCKKMHKYKDLDIHWIICETFENRASLCNLPTNRPSILQPTDVRRKVGGDEKTNRYNPSASKAAYFLVKELRGNVPTPNALDEIDKLLVETDIVQYPPSVGKLFENITLLYKSPQSVLFTGYTKENKEKRVIRQFPDVTEEFMKVFTRLHQLSRSTSAYHNVAAPVEINEKERFFSVEPHLCSFEKVHRHKAAPYAFILRAFHTIICAFKSVHSLNCLFRWFGPQSIAFELQQQMRVGISFCSTVECRNENTSSLLADYASPEGLLDADFSFAGDMWCVGATLFKMLTGLSLFVNIDPKDLKKHVQELRNNADKQPHLDVRERINSLAVAPVSPEFITLIENLLSFDPKKRPTIQQIEELSFFPNTKEKIMALPQLDVDTAKEEYAKIDPTSAEFQRIKNQIQAAQHKSADRTFIVSVESIETIHNPVLRRMHEETRRKLAMVEHGGEMHNAVSLDSVDKKHLADDKFAFYGVKAFKGQEGKDSLSAKEVRSSIAQRGLLRVGHPKNPNQKHRRTKGIIGPNTDGVYLARFPLDAVRYSVPDDRPLDDNDCAEIIVFQVALGRCNKEWKSGMKFEDYKNNYDSFMDEKDVYLRDADDQIHSTLAFPSFVVKVRIVRDEWYDPNEKTKFRISMRDEDILGKGGFGIVRRGMMLSGGKPIPIACKIFSKDNKSDMTREQFIKFCKHEFEIMQNLRDYQAVAKVIAFKECREGQVVLFMELLATSLDEMIQQFDVLKPLTAARYFKQAASGLHALELEKYVHGDIKLQNMMLSHSGEVKLTDFGLADEVDCNLCGLTWFYAAPELFVRKFSHVDTAAFLDRVNGSRQKQELLSESESSPDSSPLNNTNNRKRSESPGVHRHHNPKKVQNKMTAEDFIPSVVTHASDCYSLGVCLFRMLVKDEIPNDVLNAPTRDHPDARKGKLRIADMDYVLRRENFIKSRIPPKIAKKYPMIVGMIHRCLDFNPRNRPTFDEIRTEFHPHRDKHAAKHHSFVPTQSSPTTTNMMSSGSLLRAAISSNNGKIATRLKNSNNEDDDNDQFFDMIHHRPSDDGGMLFAPPSTCGGAVDDDDDVTFTGLNHHVETENLDPTSSDEDEVQFYNDHEKRRTNTHNNNNEINNRNCSSRAPRDQPRTRRPLSQLDEKTGASSVISVGMSAPTDNAAKDPIEPGHAKSYHNFSDSVRDVE